MEKLDLNGDGIITLGEYKVALNISSQPMDAWKEMFKDIDKDGGGTVSIKELKDFLRQTGSENLEETGLNAKKVHESTLFGWRKLLNLIDVGKSEEIEAAELVLTLEHSASWQFLPAVKDWIKKYDTNRNGKLQYKESLKVVVSTEC
ncbi:unnamed protein product [Dibothriocephalus latus]|uniref:EF-hand domain-containing protein n=1 Tax=Dibothriocephalus latus TaxID=60516 RepID=A0A3P6TLS3_DIBLA|nr:unnamed protein product [Dibothriocephalus latus]